MSCHGDVSTPGAGEPAGPVPAGHSQHAYYVAADGDDRSAGTRTGPWRTIAHALSQLAKGDTLFVRGPLLERGIRVAVAGTAAAPITIAAEPGGAAVIDGGFPQFRARGNHDWELVDLRKQIWRSVAAFPGCGRVYGYLGERDGGYRLVPYEDYGPFGTDNEVYSESAPFYVGPGVYWNPGDERIYVRLRRGRVQERLGLPVPESDDPRQTELFLFPNTSVIEVGASAAHLVFDGLALRHGEIVVELAEGCRDVTLRRCSLRGGRYEVVARGGRDLTFDGLSVRGGFPPWVARSDVKRPAGAPPAHLLQGSALQLEGELDGVEVANCTFTGLFDAIDTNGTPSHMRVHDNLFTTIRDDAFELATAGYEVEFHHNTITRAAAGVSWTWSGSPPARAAGTKYVHHNVIDTSTPQLYARDDPRGLLPRKWFGPRGDGLATGRAFDSHDMSSLTGPDPWKIYCNTIVGADDVDGEGLGVAYRYAPSDPEHPHEVFDNVFVQKGDQCVVRGARLDDGSQVFDGNLYYRPQAAPAAPLFADLRRAAKGADFARLRDFVASPLREATRRRYAPGWESAGAEGDPGLDADYRPAPGGPAAAGAVDLSARPWPGASAQTYRGALPPR